MSEPVFPIIGAAGHPLSPCSPLQMLCASEIPHYSNPSSRGFRQLLFLIPPVKALIIQVFLDLSELSQAIQCFIGSKSYSEQLSTLGDCRNSVQHRLCSLPTDRLPRTCVLEGDNIDMRAGDMAYDVYLTCRLASIIYSIHVTYPLPRPSSVRRSILPQLRDKIGKYDFIGLDGAVHEVFLWCSFIGGICSENNDLRMWFVGKICQLCSLLEVVTWSQILDLLRSFAWVDTGCNEAGAKLWQEVVVLLYN